MSPPEQIVNDMIRACCRKDFDAVFTYFHADARYHNIPIEPATGHQEIRSMLEPFLSSAMEIDWVIHHSISNGFDLVMNERTDRFLMPTGWIELPVMGVFELRHGKIAAWRDYFDAGMMKPATAT
jgi:limonene-1,2-epoxide hydrolase